MPGKPKIHIKQTADWFVAGPDGIAYGPYVWSEIVQFTKTGQVTPNTYVKHATKTSNEWRVASSVGELVQLLSPPKSTLKVSRTKSFSLASGLNPLSFYASLVGWKSIAFQALLILWLCAWGFRLPFLAYVFLFDDDAFKSPGILLFGGGVYQTLSLWLAGVLALLCLSIFTINRKHPHP